MRRFAQRMRVVWLVGVCGAALTACADLSPSPTQAPDPRVRPPDVFTNAPVTGAPVTGEADIDPAAWWTAWGDARLDALVRKAIAANPDLRSAQAHARAADALVTVARSALLPTVTANAGVRGGGVDWRLPANPLLPGLGPGVDNHTLGIAARWEPDVFGGRAADAAATAAQAQAVGAAAVAARLSVVAQVADAYTRALGARRRLVVLDEGIAALERLRAYVDGRYAAGQATRGDVDEVGARLWALKANRPALEMELGTLRRRLAVLTGTPPEGEGEALGPVTDLLVPPPSPPTGDLPSSVLERRPDVRAAADLVRARVAMLASAKADLFPRFAIDFLGQDGHLHVSGMPGGSATGGLIGLEVSLPLFTAGRLHAIVAAQDAELDAAAANYDAAVLQALADIEDAYAWRRDLDRREDGLIAQLAQADHRAQATAALYKGGAVVLSAVLEAELAALDARDALIQTRIARAAATVQLYRALAGGW